jgi:hypothetical protein
MSEDFCPNCKNVLPYYLNIYSKSETDKMVDDIVRLGEENEKLRNMLLKALGIIREGKAKFAPTTTNSLVDEWLKDMEELDGGVAEE